MLDFVIVMFWKSWGYLKKYKRTEIRKIVLSTSFLKRITSMRRENIIDFVGNEEKSSKNSVFLWMMKKRHEIGIREQKRKIKLMEFFESDENI